MADLYKEYDNELHEAARKIFISKMNILKRGLPAIRSVLINSDEGKITAGNISLWFPTKQMLKEYFTGAMFNIDGDALDYIVCKFSNTITYVYGWNKEKLVILGFATANRGIIIISNNKVIREELSIGETLKNLNLLIDAMGNGGI